MRTTILLAAIILLSHGSIAPAITLENKHVTVSIDADRGGAITKLFHKQAPTLPFIADRGAGVAGEGRLMAPVIIVGARRLNLTDVDMQGLKSASPGEIRLTGDLSRLLPGIYIERVYTLDDEESGLRMVDTYFNPTAADIKLRVGATSRMEGMVWNQTLRCWFGDAKNRREMFSASSPGTVEKFRSETGRPFWRVIGQYGTGFLCLPAAPASPVDVEMRLPKDFGGPAEFEWTTPELTIKAGAELSVSTSIMIDTGGRDGGTSEALLKTDRLIVHGDAPAAGRSGEPADCFVTVTTATPRRVRAVVTEQMTRLDWAKESAPANVRQIASFDLDLAPGMAQVRSFRHTPDHAGVSMLHMEVQDPSGERLTSTENRIVIDGDHGADGDLAKVWEQYTRKLPEYQLRGSWEEIGKQIARLKAIGSHKNQQHGAQRLAIYEKRFPLYAKLLHGAAEELKCPPEQVAASETSGAPAMADACMGIVVHGPDGPLNLYSKERGNLSFKGMAYLKVVPDTGYRYHMYTLNPRFDVGYGVNSAGLSTSGTSINCDANTERVGQEEAARLRTAGKVPAPLAMQMLLATCADVDDAIRFIDDPDSPMEFTGNLLIADLKGQSAVLESAGIRHQIFRGQPGKTMDTGNYPHVRPDGLFAIGNNWGWAANTMLRERLLGQFTTEHQGQITLPDARQFMATRTEPGGMCQHLTDNVGLLYSTCSSITVLRTRDLYISNGPPDQVQYVRYRLDE